jgi:hypothetical protein
MHKSFQGWERDVFGSVKQELVSLRRELEDVRGQSIHAGPSNPEKQLMHRILELLAREEIMEKQRSRISWLKDSDRNTKMFQAKAKERAKVNQIAALCDPAGVLRTKQEELEGLVSAFI